MAVWGCCIRPVVAVVLRCSPGCTARTPLDLQVHPSPPRRSGTESVAAPAGLSRPNQAASDPVVLGGGASHPVDPQLTRCGGSRPRSIGSHAKTDCTRPHCLPAASDP